MALVLFILGGTVGLLASVIWGCLLGTWQTAIIIYFAFGWGVPFVAMAVMALRQTSEMPNEIGMNVSPRY